jgi:small nuclear ribonucleoprotein (snRNP)-like protein
VKVSTSSKHNRSSADHNPLPVTGILKGYDQLLNLVLDEVEEEINGLAILSSLYTLLTVHPQSQNLKPVSSTL